MPAAIELPAATLRLFDGYAPVDLVAPEHRSFLIERLLEAGDSADLRFLVAAVGEGALAAYVAQWGDRRLTARSRVFWRLLLGVQAAGEGEAAAASPGGELWPLSA
jgi:hypothetical protein